MGSHRSPPLTPPTPPSWIKYNNIMSSSSSSTLNTIRNITSTIWSIRTRHQASRILRTTHLLLRCFLFFDICYLLSGISLIVMALTEQFANKEKMILFGGLFGVFASVSALCNSLASHGVRTWKRGYLIPWLGFFSMLMVFLLMELGRSLYFDRAEWRHVFLLFAIGIYTICCLLLLETHAQAVPHDVAAQARGSRHGRGGNHEGTPGEGKQHCEGCSS